MTNKFDVIIYHNPDCGTSRNTLGLIRNADIEPHVIEYLKTPPNRELIKQLLIRMSVDIRDILRKKDTPYFDLGLDDPSISDDAILNYIETYPILLNRPVVVTPWGVKLCRPSEVVLDILPLSKPSSFTKEDGELVINASGKRVI
jgi:arsenate reductase (glutaredoxin)